MGNYFGRLTAFVRKSDKIHCVVSSCVGLRKTMGPWERSGTLYDHYMKETDNTRSSFHGFDQVAIMSKNLFAKAVEDATFTVTTSSDGSRSYGGNF